jgi:hypothetical protein
VTLVPMMAARLVRSELAAQARAAERPGRGGRFARRARLGAAPRPTGCARANDRLAEWYARRLRWTLGHRLATVGVAAALFVGRGVRRARARHRVHPRARRRARARAGLVLAGTRWTAPTRPPSRWSASSPGCRARVAVRRGRRRDLQPHRRARTPRGARSTCSSCAGPARDQHRRLDRAHARRPPGDAHRRRARAGAQERRARAAHEHRRRRVEFVLSGDSLPTLLALGRALRDVLQDVPGLSGVQLTPPGWRARVPA